MKGSEDMQDMTTKDVLEMVLVIARKCKSLDELIEEIKKLIEMR